jgi:hypothetical protein
MTLRNKLAAILLSLSIILSLAVAGAAQTKASSTGSSKSERTSIREDDNNWNWHHRDGSVDLQVTIRGKVEFADDYSDIKSISYGGEIRVRDDQGGVLRKFEATADGGSIIRTYSVNGQSRAFDDDARKWLAKTLDETVRAGGYDARARVQRILMQSGPRGVLGEISRLRSDYVKRIYFDELFAQGQLDSDNARQALRLAGTEISSDYEKAQLLVKMSDSYLVNDEMRGIYVDGVNTIHSDYERGRALSALLKKGDLSTGNVLFAIKSAANIKSGYERAQLLIKIANGFALDQAAQTAYLDAVASISSDYEKGRVLAAFLKKEPGKDTLLFTLKSASTISSDYEKAQLLIKIANGFTLDQAAQIVYLDAVSSIHSDYEKGRVLSALLKKETGKETLLFALKSASAISSDYEKAQLLLKVARSNPTDDDTVRNALIQAARTIGSEYERGRVLSAVIK